MKTAQPEADTPALQCTLGASPATCDLLSEETVAHIVHECLSHGTSVEIDGLGIFRPLGCGECEFLAYSEPRVFIAYVEENLELALRLYDDLTAFGFSPWLDKKKLLPGQNWPRAIERALDVSNFALCLFSRRATVKRGGFQAELRYALDCTRRLPLDEIFLIPARLEKCAVPSRITRELQYVDLFPDWDRGLRRIVATMKRELRRQRRRQLTE